MLADPHVIDRRNFDRIHQAQQEAGVSKSHGASANAGSLIEWIRGFIGAESELAIGGGKQRGGVTLDSQLAASLVGMVAVHPGHAGVEGGFFVQQWMPVRGGSHHLHPTLPAAGAGYSAIAGAGGAES